MVLFGSKEFIFKYLARKEVDKNTDGLGGFAMLR